MVRELSQGGAKNVIKPTKAGQIPVAATVNGKLLYEPTANPIPVPTSSDIGKAPVVKTIDATGNITYEYQPVIPEDEVVKSLFNQNGIIGNPSASISTDKLSLIITPFSAVFYDPVLQTRSVVTKSSSSTVPLNATAAQTITYIYIKPDGTFGLDYTLTSSRVYLFEVITSPTTPFIIISFRPIYIIYNNIQSTLKDITTALGFLAYGFAMNYSVTTNFISQSGPTARVIGYNVNPTNVKSATRPFAVGEITFNYFAFTVADRVPNTKVVIRQYKIDNPTTATSTNITGNNFGIVLIFAGSSGGYKLLAPQLSYTSETNARNSVLTYLRNVVLPKDLSEVYTPVAALYVPANIQNNTALNIDIVAGITLGGAPLQDSAVLPAPTTAGVVKVLPNSNAYSIQPDTSTPSIDLSTFANGDYLSVQNGQVVPAKPNTILPNKEFADEKWGALRISETSILAFGGDFQGLGLTFSIAVVDAASKKNSLTISGNDKLYVMSGVYENLDSQVKFEVLPPNVIYYINDKLNPYPVDPIINPQGLPGLDFAISFSLVP